MKLKTLLLFAVLCAMPTFATGNSIDFDTGTFVSGKLTGSFASSINVDIIGSLAEIDIKTTKLTSFTVGCPPGSVCYGFTGGSVKVMMGGTAFTDSISGGITIRDGEVASIQASLTPTSSVLSGAATASFSFEGGKIVNGSEDVAFQPVATPELGTLFLFGSGMIGLVAKFRKQLIRLDG